MDIINTLGKQINFHNNTQLRFTATTSIEYFYHQPKELLATAIQAKDYVIASLREN